MSKHVELVISHLLSEQDWKDLILFCSKCERLIKTKIVTNGGASINGRFEYDMDKGMTYIAELPPEEQVAEFLMAFRFFFLNDERSNFLRILNILGKHSSNKDEYAAIKHYKNQWKNSLFNDALQFKVNDNKLTTSHLVDLWFNAHYFHADESKSKKLSELNSHFNDDYSKYMLLDGVCNASDVIFKLYNSIWEMVREHKSL